MREWKIEGPSTLPDKRERESDKLIKNSNHLRQFCEDRLCFETFQGSFAKNIFKMFTIFIKLSLLYKQRWFFYNRCKYCVIKKRVFSSHNTLFTKLKNL